MNGFMLWMVMAASGQVAGPERDYGWQIHPKDGKLEYIVQISPKEIDFMVSAAKEKASSSIPPEVAARLSRVVVRIGEEPIVSTPMDEVMRLPVVTTAVMANIEAVAGRGKFSQLESAPSGDVLTVAGSGPPPLSSTLGSSLPTPPGSTLSSAASALDSALQNPTRALDSLVAQNTAVSPNSGASAFLNDARGLLADAGATSGKYANTGSPVPGTNPAAPVGSTWPSATSGTSPSPSTSTLGTSTLGTPPSTAPYGSTTGLPQMGSQGYSSTNGGYMTNPGYPTTPGVAGATQYGGTSATLGTGGYSSTTPYNTTPYNNAPYGTAPYSTSPYGTAGSTTAPYGSATYGATPGYTTTPNYVTPGTGTTNGWSASTGNFAMPPRGSTAPTTGYAPYNPAGSTLGYSNDPLSLPSYGQNGNRVADNRPLSNLPTSFPSTSSIGMAGTAGLSPNVPVGASNTYNTKPIGPPDVGFGGANFPPHNYPNSGGMNNVLPVMFVLSLVVNFYLGMLIRKLLGRYRSLLSSVRGQAA